MKKLLVAMTLAWTAASVSAQETSGDAAALETTAVESAPATSAAVPAAAAQAPKSNLTPYTINAGDQIEVYVWGEERLQRQLRVLPDGTFSFPLVGRVHAIGKLPYQLEAEITEGLKSQYRGQVPQVTVSVQAPSGMQFSVMGKINGPGSFTPGRYVNLLEALSLAGGPSEFANLDNITIIRKTPNGLTTIRARLGGIYRRNGAAAAVARGDVPRIQSGDMVIVP